MKAFIVKLLLICLSVYVLFQITFGSIINNFESTIASFTDKNERRQYKEKIKNELKKGIEKEKYFSEDERILLSNFIKKILRELELNQN